MSVRFVDELVEDVVDGAANERPEPHEVPVDTVEDRLEVVTLPRVLRVKQLQKMQDELTIEKFGQKLAVRLGRRGKAQEKLVHHLDEGVCVHVVCVSVCGWVGGEGSHNTPDPRKTQTRTSITPTWRWGHVLSEAGSSSSGLYMPA